MTKQKQSNGKQPEGEGSYEAARRYNEQLKKHIENSDVEEEARQAREALESAEGEELEAAERRGKSGPRPTHGQKKP